MGRIIMPPNNTKYPYPKAVGEGYTIGKIVGRAMEKENERKPLSPEEAASALKKSPRWIVERGRIYRDFRFANFREALKFLNRVAAIAEKVGHHPNILIHEYAFLRLETYDHLLGGLSNFDLKLIKEIDRALGRRR